MSFHYHQPASLAEASTLLRQYNGAAAVLNGGTDVLVRKNKGICREHIVNIKMIPDLDYIRAEEKFIKIGALTKLAAVAENAQIRAYFPVLAQAVKSIGTPQIRNLGTLSGNLCNASPVADSAPALLALGASLRLQSMSGSRFVPLEAFHIGPGKTVLAVDELLTEICIPLPEPGFVASFGKIGPRKAADIAVVNAAVGLTFRDGVCAKAVVALGAVAPKPIRAATAEQALLGKTQTSLDAATVGALAARAATPISDVRGSLEYRREMVAVLAERALLHIESQMKGAR